MQISIHTHNNITICSIVGRLDAVTTVDFEKTLNTCFNEGAQSIIVDMTGIAYASSAGLRGILLMQQNAQKQNLKFILCNVQSAVANIFTLVGFYNILNIYDTVDAAIAALTAD